VYALGLPVLRTAKAVSALFLLDNLWASGLSASGLIVMSCTCSSGL
jgi:hypothetical protein